MYYLTNEQIEKVNNFLKSKNGFFDSDNCATVIEENDYFQLLNEIKEKKDIKIAIRESFLKMNKLIEGKEGMKEIYDLRLKNNEEEIKNYKNVINENKEEKINIFQEEDKEILDYTGCTLCLIIIDSELNKIYFGNIGNSELFIYKNNNSKDIINIKSQHRPNDETEKSRIKNTSLIINNKLYGVLKSSRSFGNFAYNGENNIIIDEPDIKEYDINDEDKYIFIANETFVDILKNENVGELIKRREEAGDISLEGIIEGILDKKISNYFFNNDIGSGFDNITCTLIKLKNK